MKKHTYLPVNLALVKELQFFFLQFFSAKKMLIFGLFIRHQRFVIVVCIDLFNFVAILM